MKYNQNPGIDWFMTTEQKVTSMNGLDDDMMDSLDDVKEQEQEQEQEHRYYIPDEELGPLSPLKVQCSDGRLYLNDFITKDKLLMAVQLLTRVFRGQSAKDFMTFDEKEKMYLIELNNKLDIPRTCLAYMVLDVKPDVKYPGMYSVGKYDRSEERYHQLKHLISCSYTRIPSWLKTTPRIYGYAAKYGDVEVGMHIGSKKYNNRHFWDLIVKYNQVQFAEWLNGIHPVDSDVKKHLSEDAAQCGSYEILIWLRDSWSRNIARLACAAGHLKILQLLREEKFEHAWYMTACESACESGHWEIIRWAHSVGYFISPSCMEYASQEGNVQLLDWLYDVLIRQGHVLGGQDGLSPLLNRPEIYRTAAEYGHIDVLKWALDHGIVWDEEAAIIAAYNGRIDVFEFIEENKLPYDIDACFQSLSCAYDMMKRLFGDRVCNMPSDAWRIENMSKDKRDKSKPIIGGHVKLYGWLKKRIPHV